MTISTLLVVLALILAIVSGAGLRVPLWIAVFLLAVAWLLNGVSVRLFS